MGILSFWWEDKLRLVRHDFVRVRCWSLCRIIRCEGSYPKGERQSCGLVRGYGRYGAIAAGTTDLDDFCIHLCHFVSLWEFELSHFDPSPLRGEQWDGSKFVEEPMFHRWSAHHLVGKAGS